ncbi:mannan endo-1,4-beta-mannosidase [Candidatus Omnitrophus magneticus]|uniref:Mannan endo-1,4-beta-mannosidase n=1 Tax=Candidatus Omnitrophus magneticus TaxID=1609969 RepID=A0A0F0CUK7_9BACT|nr:mannan endo-1,4-beta-mannosidase [Candidatus Omnitrophus magneticus]
MLVAMVLFFTALTCRAFSEEEILFDFENGLQGWEIPDWAFEKPDHVQKSVAIATDVASTGKQSMVMMAEFPGGRWAGALIEIMQYFDWSGFSQIAYDIYIPADAPQGLQTKLILTVGDAWKWVEMSRAFPLEPGKWVTVTADIKPGSIDWRRIQVDETFRQDVRKMDIRVFSNNKPAYKGAIYIDNVRIIKE